MQKFIGASLLFVLGSCSVAEPAATPSMNHGMGSPRMAGGCHAPAGANHGKFGCYFDAEVVLSAPPATLFYHIDEYAERDAALRAATSASAVVTAYGRVFLQTINGDERWRPRGGARVATIGPMPAPTGRRVTARFMQAMTRPGATTQPHSHDGPEAFHIISGAICMETPEGTATTAAGRQYWIGGGRFMQLSSVGSEVRRSLFVVLHPSDRPWMNVGVPWTPFNACLGRSS